MRQKFQVIRPQLLIRAIYFIFGFMLAAILISSQARYVYLKKKKLELKNLLYLQQHGQLYINSESQKQVGVDI